MRRFAHPFIGMLLAVGCAVVSETIARAFTIVTVHVGTNPGQSAVIPQTNEVVVINGGSNDVSVIDPVTLKVSAVPSGSMPADVTVNPATGYAYVVNSWGDSVTAFYGYGEGKKRKTIPVGVGPVSVTVNAALNKVYVVNNGEDTISVIDENAGTMTKVPVGQRPWKIAVNAATNRAYVVNIWSNSVSVLDGVSDALVDTVAVGAEPYAVVTNPVTNRIYVANAGSGTISVIDGSTHAAFEIPAGIQPTLLAVNTVKNTIYVADGQQNDVTVIDGATGATTHLAMPVGRWGVTAFNTVSVNEVTNQIYVVDNMAENINVIDGATNEVTLRPVGAYPFGATINPATNKVYVSHVNDGTVTVISE